jgi:hypothetical protein
MRRMRSSRGRSLPARALRLAGRVLRGLALTLLALLIAFEEWGWEPLQRVFARLARLPWLRRVETAIASLPPKAALLVLLVPTLLLLPAKLAAVWLIARGQTLLGLVAVGVAKVVGTAVAAWLFTLTRPALLRLAWFARLYRRWTRWKNALLAWLRASAPWQLVRRLRRGLRERWARWRAALFRT